MKSFWSKVNMSEGCWDWQGGLISSGYGSAYHPKLGPQAAHRLAWILTNGDIPKGLYVLHKCDNKKCVNPDHLYLGTQKKNLEDAKLHGLTNTGTKHWSSTLTESEVLLIRKMHKSGSSIRLLADIFNQTYKNVWQIVNNKRWQHLKDES